MAVRNDMSEKKQLSKKGDSKETIDRLKQLLNKQSKELKRLRSENKSLQEAWTKTEEYIQKLTANVSILDMIHESQIGEVKNVTKTCPNCSNRTMKQTTHGSLCMVYCKCGYRNRVNGNGSSET